MKNLNLDEICNELEEMGIVTFKELQLVTNINGYTFNTLNDIIYARTGYRSFEQLTDEYNEGDYEEEE